MRTRFPTYRTHPRLLLIIVPCLLLLQHCGGGGGIGSGATSGTGTTPVAVNVCAATPAGEILSAALPGAGSGAMYSAGNVAPVKGSVTIDASGNFTYTPFRNFPSGDGFARGMDTFSYRVTASERTTEGVVTVFIDGPARIMPLGDSITWGITVGDSHPQQPPLDQRVGYRKALQDSLVGGGYHVGFVGTLSSGAGLLDDPGHEGHGGWTADQLVNGNPTPDPGTGSGSLSQWLNTTQPDVVLVHIGTNDLNGNTDPAKEAEDVDAILNTIENWGSANWPVWVILARIINTSPTLTSADRRAATTTFNNAIADTVYPRHAGTGRVILVDQESTLTSASDYGDAIHPNADGYQKMAAVWRPALASVVSKCR